MTDTQHIRSEDYAQVDDGELPPESLALRIHEHLLRVCPACADTYRRLGSAHGAVRELLARAGHAEAVPGAPGVDATPPGAALSAEEETGAPSPPPREIPEEVPDLHLSGFAPDVEEEDRVIERSRAIRRRARKEVWKLLQVPPEQRLDKIRRAFSQYRHRATAEYLLERTRDLVDSDPAEAASLASLVPAVLYWTPGAPGTPWAHHLNTLAGAWYADALRAAGDLRDADRSFSEQRLKLTREPVESNSPLGELYALEARLRIDQGRFEEADELLDLAVALARHSPDVEGHGRLLLQHGDLLAALGRAGEAAERYEAAERHLAELPPSSWLRLSAVAGRVRQLSELDRLAEAAALLQAHLDAFEECEAVSCGPRVRGLRGRIALGLGELRTAEKLLLSCRDGYLAVEHPAGAALACLDLVALYRRSRRPADLLRSVARQLVGLCRDLDLPAGTVAEARRLAEQEPGEPQAAAALRLLRRDVQLVPQTH